MRWDPPQEEPGVVQAGRMLLVVPSLDAQCVACTRRGQRCRNGIISCRGFFIEGATLLWCTRGVLPVWVFSDTKEDLRVWTEQRCSVHDTPEATDHTAPEWYRFDPDRDAAFIWPFPVLPRMPAPPQEWARASWELTQLWEIGHRQHLSRRARVFTTPGHALEPAPGSPAATAFAALEQILACHHDLPALDWTLTATCELTGVLPGTPVTDLDERREAFTAWAGRLHAVHRSEHRRKGYLDLRAHTADGAPVPVRLRADINDSIASTGRTP